MPSQVVTLWAICLASVKYLPWEPPEVIISDNGWDINYSIPKPCTGVAEFAPTELLKIVAFGCSYKSVQNASTCSRNKCLCRSATTPCTSFCKCQAQDNCNNPNTKHEQSDSESEEDQWGQIEHIALTWALITKFEYEYSVRIILSWFCFQWTEFFYF